MSSIPIVYQSTNLHFYKTEYGYLSRVYNTEGDFPLCKEPFLSGNIVEVASQNLQQKICTDPINLGRSQIKFEDETYEITVRAVVPEDNHNPQSNTVVVMLTEFVGRNNITQSFYTQGVPAIERFSLKSIVNGVANSLGVKKGDLVMKVAISNEFPNSEFQTQVLNIEFRHPNVVIRNGIIEIKAIVGGIRGFMIKWYWISMFVIIFTMTVCLFIGLHLTWRLGINGKDAAISKIRRTLVGGGKESTKGALQQRGMENYKNN